MADFLALDWEEDGVLGVDASVQRDRVTVRSTFQLAWPAELDIATNHEQVGEWLKGELAARGISTRQALVSLAREDAVVRQLELPNTPDDELPELVRFQAATKSTVPLNQLHLDFLPTPVLPGAVNRDVLIASIKNRQVATIQAIAAAAGFEVKSIGLSSLSSAELVALAERKHQGATDDLSLVLARHAERVEITLMRLGRVLTTHSAQLHGDVDADTNREIVSEINRLRVSMHRTLPDASIGRVWVFGRDEETDSLRSTLTERLRCDVHALDPFDAIKASVDPHPTETAMFAGPLGMLAAIEQRLVPTLDFLNPRKPVVKPDKRKRTAIMASAVSAVVLIGSITGFQLYLSGQDKEIKLRNGQVAEQYKLLKDGTPILAAAAVVRNWETGDVNVLDQLVQTNDVLPGTDRIYLKDLTIASANTGKIRLTIQASGGAVDRKDVDALKARFHDAKYDVLPLPLGKRRSDRKYAYPFDVNAQIPHAEEKSDKK